MANSETISFPGPVVELGRILRRVTEKEPKLAHGLRDYIARLKREGRFEEAMRIAHAKRQEKIMARHDEAEKALQQEILAIAEAETEEDQGIHEIRAIWLVSALNTHQDNYLEVRKREIEETIDSKGPNLRAFLEGNLIDIRDEMRSYLPPTTKTRR